MTANWAVVSTVTPLAVTVWGDTATVTPATFVDPARLAVGDVVQIAFTPDGQLVVTGRAGGPRRGVIGQIPSTIQVASGSYTLASDGTVNVSGASSFSLNGVFDGLGGDAYRLIGWLSASADTTGLFLRLRRAGADDATASYNGILPSTTAASWANPASNLAAVSAGTSWQVGSKQIINLDFTVRRPAITGATNRELLGQSISDGSTQALASFGGRTGTINPCDGFTIFAAAAVTLTGWVKVVKEA